MHARGPRTEADKEMEAGIWKGKKVENMEEAIWAIGRILDDRVE